MGECAGEVVSLTDFGMAAAEGLYFDAQVELEAGPDPARTNRAADLAYRAMVSAAQALIKQQNVDISNDPDVIVREFKHHFFDTQLFFDPFAKGKFAHYLFDAHAARNGSVSRDAALELVEEAGLFIEATHACNTRLLESQAREGVPA